MDTCMCIAASLCCPLETITVLSIVIYKVKRLKKKKKEFPPQALLSGNILPNNKLVQSVPRLFPRVTTGSFIYVH